jgi:hypothetical protein
VSSHEGIEGNETAEQLAKFGSEFPLTGPEPACGVMSSPPVMISDVEIGIV